MSGFDRNSPGLTTVVDEGRKETHVISAAHQQDANGSYISTNTWTFAHEEFRQPEGIAIEHIGPNVVAYRVEDNVEANPSQASSDLEMIDLVDVCDDEHIGHPLPEEPLPEEQNLAPAIRVPLTSLPVGMRRPSQAMTGNAAKRKTDEELLHDALENCRKFTEALKDSLEYGRNIRMVHVLYDGREFGLMSARVRADCGSEEIWKGTVAVLWQTMTRTKKAVCINFEESEAGHLMITCTCNMLTESTTTSGEECEHVQTCRGDEVLRHSLAWALTHDGYFGTSLHPEMDSSPASQLVRGNLGQSRGTQAKTNAWSFWVVFDVDRRKFVPLLKGSNQRFQCLLCRFSRSRRGFCVHEMSCKDAEEASIDVLGSDTQHDSCAERDVGDKGKQKSEARGFEKYMQNTTSRSLLMCPGEANSIRVLSNLLSNMHPNSFLRVWDGGLATCPKCRSRQPKGCRTRYRAVELFTLSHGSPYIYVTDWFCPCGILVPFSGECIGIFPARKHSAFTVELLYFWVQIVCYQGQSLRQAYYTSKLFSDSHSARQLLRDRTPEQEDMRSNKKSQRNRRRANEAFRKFLQTIDVGRAEAASKLFSCEACEVPLNESDKLELGLCNVNTEGLKRFRAVAIDGTAAGIRNPLPHFERKLKSLRAPTFRLKSRMVKSRRNRKAIKELFSLARRRVRQVLEGMRRRAVASESAQFYLSPAVCRRMKRKNTQLHMSTGLVDIVRIYLDTDTCFCGRSWSRDDEHLMECCEKHKGVEDCGDPEGVAELLQVCFELQRGVPEAEAIVGGDDEDEVMLLPDRKNSDDEPERIELDSVLNARQLWMAMVRVRIWKAGGQLVESLLDLVEFLLTEHVGFVYILPFRPTTDDNEVVEARFVEPGKLVRNCKILATPSIQMHGQVASKMKVFADCGHTSNEDWPCVECIAPLAAILIRTRNVNPALTRFCAELLSVGVRIPRTSRRLAWAVSESLTDHIKMAAEYFEDFDRHASQAIGDYWEENGSALVQPLTEALEDENLCHEDDGDEDGNAMDEGAADWREDCVDDADGEEGSEEEGQETEEDEAKLSGICFPGRRRYRYGVVFEGPESHHCAKAYPVSEIHSPGIMTLQCTCKNPELIGFILMTKAESTELALSIILTHFPIPPRVVYYDNACNLFASAMLRTPWLLHMCRILVDRFHYKGHKCSSFFDPDSYSELDDQRTTSAESINARIEKSLHHMRYLNGKNFVPFLRVRFALLNLAAKYQQRYKVSDMEDEDLPTYLSKILVCDCVPCRWIRAEGRNGTLPEQWEDADEIPPEVLEDIRLACVENAERICFDSCSSYSSDEE